MEGKGKEGEDMLPKITIFSQFYDRIILEFWRTQTSIHYIPRNYLTFLFLSKQGLSMLFTFYDNATIYCDPLYHLEDTGTSYL